MKKINSLLIGVSILFAGFFTTSCNKDTTNDATIGLVAGTGYITESTSVTAGSTLKFKWTATSTPNMKYISIARDGVALSGDGWSMKEINSSYENAYNGEASLTAPLSGGPYVYSIIVYDKDQTELARVEVTITITAAAGPINTLDSRTFGSGSNPSYYDVETNTVYNYTDASGTAVKPTIDFVYDSDKVWGTSTLTSSTGATFAETSITTAQFDAATDDALFASISTSATSVTAAANKVIAFTLKSGKKGLMKITNFVSGTNGSITFVIKVQQ
jgi:hypothetical protein